jgi:hypothetical protein
LFVALLILALMSSAPAQAQDSGDKDKSEKEPSSSSVTETPAKSWAQLRSEARDFWPRQWEETKAKVRSLRIVRKPRTSLTSFESNPTLWRAITTFYETIKGRELDMFAEQTGLPEMFPNRETYYDFLDTILPAMRARKFERNRILSYTIHAINSVSASEADVVISIRSDDVFRIGKTMLYHHSWHNAGYTWYPGKVSAEPATLWEKYK